MPLLVTINPNSLSVAPQKRIWQDLASSCTNANDPKTSLSKSTVLNSHGTLL